MNQSSMYPPESRAKQRHSPVATNKQTVASSMLYPPDSPTKQRRQSLPRNLPVFTDSPVRKNRLDSPVKFSPVKAHLPRGGRGQLPFTPLNGGPPASPTKRRHIPVQSPYAEKQPKRYFTSYCILISMVMCGSVLTAVPYVMHSKLLHNSGNHRAADDVAHKAPKTGLRRATAKLRESREGHHPEQKHQKEQQKAHDLQNKLQTAKQKQHSVSPPNKHRDDKEQTPAENLLSNKHAREQSKRQIENHKPVEVVEGHTKVESQAKVEGQTREADEAVESSKQAEVSRTHTKRYSNVAYNADGTLKIPSPPPVSKVQVVSRTSKEPKTRFAYVYVVGGCDPENPAYRNFLYNVVISTHIQREEASRHDVIVFVQMTHSSWHTTLPKEDVHLLSHLNIHIHYLEKDPEESFDNLMLAKFHVLELDYERVMYLDADVMARGSLDYLFYLSADGTLQENVVFAGRKQPAIGALFIVSPKSGDFEKIRFLQENNNTGDAKLGWGHAFENDEVYTLVNGRKGSDWNFPGAFADEGLLFHWVKYEKKSVSIVLKDRIQNWAVGADGKLTMKTVKLDVFNSLTRPHRCWENTMNHKPCRPPHSDYFHYQGTLKPWLQDPPDNYEDDMRPASYWFHMLSVVNAKYELGIDIGNWKRAKRPLLGMHPNNWDTRATSAVSETATENSNENKKKVIGSSGFAYAFVVGGVDPDKPAYRFFLQNILVNAHVLREGGSIADIVVYFQMSYSSKHDSLTEQDLLLLNAMSIKIQYVPKAKDESFDQLMMEKFRVLSLTQYDRVLYLDSDVMLRGSLDYLFNLSLKGDLKRNVVFAGQSVPAIGTIFMVQPLEGEWDRVLDIVREKEDRGATLSFPHWDADIGWGHAFEGNDGYELITGQKDSRWGFPGSSGDQGLLFHWVKYEEKSVSIVMLDTIQNWNSGADGKVYLEGTLALDIFDGLVEKHVCWPQIMERKPCTSPWSDFVHFSGSKKPWLHKPPANLSKEFSSHSPLHSWYHKLSLVNDKLPMGLDFSHWRVTHRPLLGMHPNNIDAVVSAPESQESSKADSAQFAYAYAIVDCNPEEPADYRNAIDDILVSTRLQRNEGSKADVLVFFQLSYDSKYSALPDNDVKLLADMNIKLQYIPKMEDESFERQALQKFRVLGLTQYDRVLFMACDIMARGSLDYLFQLSKDGIIKDNLVLSGPNEPSIGSFFMIAPKRGDWDQVLDIIRAKEERGAGMSGIPWDEQLGWGHAFEGSDGYQTIDGRTKATWDFPGASSDQGLLYHFTKYHKGSLSIIMRDTIQNWGFDSNRVATLEQTIGIDIFEKLAKKRNCWDRSFLNGKLCAAPHSDFVHFGSLSKPWITGKPEDLSATTSSKSPSHVWHTTLMELDKELKIRERRKEQVPVAESTENGDDMGGVAYHEPEVVISPYTKNVTRAHRFAYTYVIGGCKPEDPSYRNYINDIMISTYVAREDGSQADVIIFIQMSFASKYDVLPDDDLRLLNAMDIQVMYIPKAEDESFYRIMLDKFQVLALTQYERVIFMDGDVLVRGNLDYLCEMSVQGVLKENLVFAGQTEPANGGFFMLAPSAGAPDRIMDIIHQKEKRGAAMPYPHWDEAVGWGQAFEEGDYYELLNTKKKNTWDFYGAFADQGLLYHWVKYEEKSVSIVFRKHIQNWSADADGKVHLEKTLGIEVFKKVPGARECWREVMKHKPCEKPHSDFIHFTGKSKPWLAGPPDDLDEVPESTSPKHYWFYILGILNEKMQIGIDFKNWRTRHRPLLGMFPQHKDAAKTTYSSAKTEG